MTMCKCCGAPATVDAHGYSECCGEKLENPGALRLAELWDIAAVLGIDKETLKSVI